MRLQKMSAFSAYMNLKMYDNSLYSRTYNHFVIMVIEKWFYWEWIRDRLKQ